MIAALVSARAPLAMHLRSSTRPQVVQTSVGRVRVWTECGELVDAVLVDNLRSTCRECCQVDSALAAQQPIGQAMQGPAGGTARPSPGQTGS